MKSFKLFITTVLFLMAYKAVSQTLSTAAWAAELPHSGNPGIAGKVISVSGVVLIRSGESPDAKSQVLKAGTFFRSSDILITSSNGFVKLLFQDRSIIDVGPSTLFEVRKFNPKKGNDREVDLDLTYGSVRAVVTEPLKGKGRFKIRTPSATMGVRGTEFLVKSSIDQVIKPNVEVPQNTPGGLIEGSIAATSSLTPSKMEVIVLQGKVDVATPPQPKGPDGTGGKAGGGSGVVSLSSGQALVANMNSNAPVAPLTLSQEQVNTAVSTARVEDNTFKKSIVIDLKTPSATDQSKASESSQKGVGEQIEKSEKSEKTEESKSQDTGRNPDSVVADQDQAGPNQTDSNDPGRAGPVSTTQDMVQEVVVAAVEPVITAPSGPSVPVIDMGSYIPVNQAPAPVIVPPGGLRHVTIKVTR